MRFEIGTIKHLENAPTPKIEVVVNVNDEAKSFQRNASVRIYLESKDYTMSEIKTEAVKAAKEFLSGSVKSAARRKNGRV